jgi:hypothetical protein
VADIESLLAVLERQAPDGGAAFSDEQIASVLPWLIAGVAQNADLTKLDVREQDVLAELFGALGVRPDQDAAALTEVVAAWPPPDGDLLKELNAVVREIIASAGVAGAADAVKKLIGADAVQGVLERTAPPPQGAVAGGPMARFAAIAELDKKKS